MPMTPEERERYDRIDRQLEVLAARQAQLSSDIAKTLEAATRRTPQNAKRCGKTGRSERHTGHNNDEMLSRTAIRVRLATESVLHLERAVRERDRKTKMKLAALNQKLGTLLNAAKRRLPKGGSGKGTPRIRRRRR